MPIFCSNCGAENQEGAQFCSKCGKSIVSSLTTSKAELESADTKITVVVNNVNKTPVFSFFGICCGILGIFTLGFIFVPLGLLFTLIGLLRGEFLVGTISGVINVIGFFTSPVLMALIGFGAVVGTAGLTKNTSQVSKEQVSRAEATPAQGAKQGAKGGASAQPTISNRPDDAAPTTPQGACGASKKFAIPMQRVGKAYGFECNMPGEVSASFDCDKAASSIEKSICNSESLRAKDCFLKYAYFDALNGEKDSCEQDRVRAEQRTWIQSRNITCGKTEAAAEKCLESEISKRGIDLIQKYRLSSEVYSVDSFATTELKSKR